MKFYTFPLSPNCRRAKAVIEHLDIKVDEELVNLADNAQKKPEYLAINPMGKVPSLVDGDLKLFESQAIMIYLCEKTPGQTLWPSDPIARADVLRWMFWDSVHFGPNVAVFVAENVMKPMRGGTPDEAALKRAEEPLHQAAKVLDAHLANREWVVGRNLSLVDFSIAARLGFLVPAKIPLQSYTNILRWNERLDTVPAWKKSAQR